MHLKTITFCIISWQPISAWIPPATGNSLPVHAPRDSPEPFCPEGFPALPRPQFPSCRLDLTCDKCLEHLKFFGARSYSEGKSWCSWAKHSWIQLEAFLLPFKTCCFWSSPVAQWLTNLTSIYEDVGSITGLAQRVKDLELLWALV